MTTAATAAGRAASPRARVLAQGRFEAMTLLRNGEQLLVSIILPVMALVGLVATSVPDLGTARRVDVAAAGTLALAVASTAFTGQAISTAFDRRNGVLRLLGTTPLGRGGLLGGKAIAVAVVLLVQLVVLGVVAAIMGWRPDPAGIVPALVSIALGAGAFVGLALLIAGTLRAEAVLAVANLLWVVFLGLGLLLPTSLLPGPVGTLAAVLPSGALGDAMRAALLDGAWPWPQWLILGAWALLAGLLARRFFRFSDS